MTSKFSIRGRCHYLGAMLIALAAANSALAYVTFGHGHASKWGDNTDAGSGAIVTWGFMADGTGVDPNKIPDAGGMSGTSNISSLRTTIDSQYGAGSFNAAIQNALNTWSAVANITFVGPMLDTGLPAGSPSALTPDIRIGAFHSVPSTFFASVGALSYGPPGFRIEGGDQFPDSGDLFLNLDGPGTFQHFQIAAGVEDVTPINYQYGNDLQELVLHELGHGAIGLGHPPAVLGATVDQRVMYIGDFQAQNAAPCCLTLNHQLSADDIAGAQHVYGIRGDYNRDSRVDAADYTVWRDTLGQHPTSGDSADGNVDGTIDQSDYNTWKANFGIVGAVGIPEPPTPGSAAPEPSTLTLLLLCASIIPINAIGRRAIRSRVLCTIKFRDYHESLSPANARGSHDEPAPANRR
jgi:Dockerin type I domain